MRRLRSLPYVAAAALALWLLAGSVLGVVAVEGALHPVRRPLGPGDWAAARGVAEGSGAALTDVSVAGGDGAVLRGWSLRPAVWNGTAVLLLHGQGDNRGGMLGAARLLLRHGYSVVLPDARAHGESGGALATYGVLEADDLRRWYEWIESQQAPRCIDGLGNSMGAAELLRSLAKEPGFCAVVADSPFASFREASYIRLGQQLGAGPWLGRTLLRPVVEAGIVYARMRYQMNLEEASPLKAVAASGVPVLLIHGLADDNLPPRQSEMIQAAQLAAVLWEPAGAGHCGAASTEPAEYERRVLGWFGAHQPH